MKPVTTLIGLLHFVLQAWGLGLSWPGDGSIVAGQTIQVSFDGGLAPYTLTVLGFIPKGGDSQLQVFSNQQGPNVQWRVSVPDGYVRFNVTDAGGGTIISYWQIVYPDPNIAVSSVSVASTASMASAQSLSAFVSRLSTSAQAAMQTGPAASQGGPGSTATSAPSPGSSSNVGPIVGGVIGGVAGLLLISLFAFWWVRRSYPHPSGPSNSDDGTTTAYAGGGGWGPNATDKEPNMAQTPLPYNPYHQHSPPVVSPVPTTPIQVQHQQQSQHGIYEGLPEIQGGAR